KAQLAPSVISKTQGYDPDSRHKVPAVEADAVARPGFVTWQNSSMIELWSERNRIPRIFTVFAGKPCSCSQAV
ncbi:hypothetical protein O5173_26360, partial [Escherichia coli]|nr:hypothetical protein [Escherichia coli]